MYPESTYYHCDSLQYSTVQYSTVQYQTLEMWSIINSSQCCTTTTRTRPESGIRPHFERTDKGKQRMYSYYGYVTYVRMKHYTSHPESKSDELWVS